jgi:hypothetical protein
VAATCGELVATAHRTLHCSVWQQYAVNCRILVSRHTAGYHSSGKLLSALKMVKTESSGKCVNLYQAIRLHVPQGSNLDVMDISTNSTNCFCVPNGTKMATARTQNNIWDKLFTRNTRAKCLCNSFVIPAVPSARTAAFAKRSKLP